MARMSKFPFWALFALVPAIAGAQATIIPNPSGGGGGGGSVTGGACAANMVATSNNSQAVPGCVTVTSSYVDNSIALTGVDINTSNQVKSLHMAAPVQVGMGGTGLASYTQGSIVYASALTVLSQLTDVAVGNVLLSGGVATNPSYGKVTLTGHVSGILPSANGGTNNAFINFSGPTTSTKTWSGPDASTTLLTTNAAVTVPQGGTGQTNLAAHGVLLGNGTSAVNCVTPDTSGKVLTSNGVSADATWQTVTGTGTDDKRFVCLAFEWWHGYDYRCCRLFDMRDGGFCLVGKWCRAWRWVAGHENRHAEYGRVYLHRRRTWRRWVFPASNNVCRRRQRLVHHS